jgi:hypothetical protein
MPPQWWFQYNSSDKAGITPTSAAAPIAMKYSVYVSYLAVPYWVFALVAAAYPIYSLIDLPNERRRKRFAAGQCTACGYDLRHTPDRCPECGLVPGNASPPARRFPRIGPIRGKIVARICLYPFFFAGFVFAFVEGYFWYYRK